MTETHQFNPEVDKLGLPFGELTDRKSIGFAGSLIFLTRLTSLSRGQRFLVFGNFFYIIRWKIVLAHPVSLEFYLIKQIFDHYYSSKLHKQLWKFLRYLANGLSWHVRTADIHANRKFQKRQLFPITRKKRTQSWRWKEGPVTSQTKRENEVSEKNSCLGAIFENVEISKNWQDTLTEVFPEANFSQQNGELKKVSEIEKERASEWLRFLNLLVVCFQWKLSKTSELSCNSIWFRRSLLSARCIFFNWALHIECFPPRTTGLG